MMFRKTYVPISWFDVKTEKVEYGIDIIINGTTFHCAVNGNPLLFNTSHERDKKLQELRKGK